MLEIYTLMEITSIHVKCISKMTLLLILNNQYLYLNSKKRMKYYQDIYKDQLHKMVEK
jgi:hypothetical protein